METTALRGDAIGLSSCGRSAIVAVLVWAVAAALVAMVGDEVAPVKIAVVVVAAGVYGKLQGARMSFTHAAVVGIAWMVLSIAAELALAAWSGHEWFQLLGQPGSPTWRAALLLAWAAAPTLFVRA